MTPRYLIDLENGIGVSLILRGIGGWTDSRQWKIIVEVFVGDILKPYALHCV